MKKITGNSDYGGASVFLKVIFPVLAISSLLFFTVFRQIPYAQEDKVSRIDFISIISRSQPDNPFLPEDHVKLSKEELYKQITNTLQKRGYKVLEGKNPNEMLTNQEFVRVTYAFSGAPVGKSLFEQKLFLKEKGVIETADVGLITGIEGKVLQFFKGGSSFSNVSLADPIFMRDRFETDLDAKALFNFDDGSSMTLGEDAVVNITKHVYNPDKNFRQTLVKVSLGTVRFVVSKAKGKGSLFQVITPTAVAGVRGTEFVTIVQPGGQTRFIGIKDTIKIRPILPGGREGVLTLLSAGQLQDIAKDGKAAKVIVAPPEIMQRIIEKTTTPQTFTPNQGITTARAISAASSKTLANIALLNKSDKKLTKKSEKEAKSASKGAANLSAKTAAKSTAKYAAKAAVKLAAKKEVMSAIRKILKIAAKNSAKTAAKVAARSAAKTAARSAAKTAARSAAKVAAQSAAKTAAKSAAKDAAQSAAKVAAKSAAKDAAQSAAKVAAKSAAKDAAKSAAKKSSKGSSKSSGKGKR